MLLYHLHELNHKFWTHTVMPPASLYGIAIGQHRMHMAQELLPFTFGSMEWWPGELNITPAQMSPSGTASAICDMLLPSHTTIWRSVQQWLLMEACNRKEAATHSLFVMECARRSHANRWGGPQLQGIAN